MLTSAIIKAPHATVRIETRANAAQFGDKIRSISSTEPQPYVAANFNAEGVLIGGKTCTANEVARLIAKARDSGFEVTETAGV